MEKKSFQEKIVTTASPEQKRTEKKFSTQIITTKDLSDEQIRQGLEGPELEPIVTTKDVKEKKNEEQKT